MKDQEKTDADKEKLNLALSEAIQKNDVPTVRALIKNGADLKWFNPKQNRKTPLIMILHPPIAEPTPGGRGPGEIANRADGQTILTGRADKTA